MQVEFYFSDSNLPRDAFMLEQVRAHPEGFVPLALLATFSRMAGVLKVERKKGATAPPEVVVAVADAVSGSTLLELSEDRTAVKRVNVRRCLPGRGGWGWEGYLEGAGS